MSLAPETAARIPVPAGSAVVGWNRTVVDEGYETVPATVDPCEVVTLIWALPDWIGSPNVNTIGDVVGTWVAPAAGVVDVTAGGVVSLLPAVVNTASTQ
jgi:hypothetical protein